MKYDVLVKLLRFLVLTKRFLWWIGSQFFSISGIFFAPFWKFLGFIHYKLDYFWKKAGVGSVEEKTLRRANVQVAFFLVLLIVTLPQTKLFVRKTDAFLGQNTIAYSLAGSDEVYGVEEITAQDSLASITAAPTWRQGALSAAEIAAPGAPTGWQQQDISGIFAGGMAISRPSIIPGALIGGTRNKIIEYIIQPGDSLGGIAYQFGISVQTILWQNNLTLRSLIKPGQVLLIPPTSGVMHTIKKGDNLIKIAKLYGAKVEDIISFNSIKEDGSDLKVGDTVMVPGGTKVVASAPVVRRTTATAQVKNAPPGSTRGPSAAGFVWPSAGKLITQYHNWKHHGLDIAGAPMGTPNYAAKAGTVLISQCGWNNGYGCYIVLDHGGGVKTLYGHNSQLLVSPGDYVEAGQTIALMGNTGNVRGVTGIHLHFEIIINGGRVNPLSYVR